MNNTLENLETKQKLPDPIQIKSPEPWQWNVLAKAFLNDPVLKFWIGEKTNEAVLRDFFEAVVKDALESGGAVFSSPDQQVVLVWTWHGYSLQEPGEWKKRWYEILDPEGVKRYYELYRAGDVEIDSAKLKGCMLPDYMGVLPQSQGRGYGSHILKWTLNHYDKLGYETPFLLASTRRSAKLYGPLVGFHIHKEVLLDNSENAPVAVFMKRNALK
ncbi:MULTISPECIES: GNAT family N-acetyltransferase [Olivibacter]|uniref:N-acetyltransferase domain-containing protein n=2 Tax=Olivibacter TaxID=376469 RepID=A0ABV6HPJ1_9SPHI|nr:MULTISPECIES: GNAT family N-acetyltransferase [unclassified Olivibacter]MDM8173595.1 GNAT family N-acetyltransferase [Olivibacter sp. 47]QEL03309.1 GNAT family N-acetyltransferase [Olivibacter sp. LS-1]